MKLRGFNKEGIERFRAFLSEGRENPEIAPPLETLDDPALTVEFADAVELEPRTFIFKRDAAEYLHEKLAPLSHETKMKNAGLWSWLTLFYFDSAAPLEEGKRKILNDYRYIYEPNSSRNYYRHLFFISWRILDIAPKFNRLMFCSRLSIQDSITTVIMKSLYLTRIPCLFEVLERIYWDKERGRPKNGMITTKTLPGGLEHRFLIRIRQLEKTYDLPSLNADQLLELLGEEFGQTNIQQDEESSNVGP